MAETLIADGHTVCGCARNAGAIGEFLHIVAPMTWRATAVTALAASALCLGEVAASGRVDTPGWQPYALMLLDRAGTPGA